MQSSDRTDRRANLLMIVVDCLRADRCPVSADDDRLGLRAWAKLRESGTVFTQAISSASVTPTCFAGLLTGEYSFVHGVRTIHGPAMDRKVPTIATSLKEAGYTTHAFMTGPMLDVLGTDRGFDEYEHRERDVYVHGEWGSGFFEKFQGICTQDSPWFTLLHLFEVHCPRQTNGIPARKHSVKEYDLGWQQLDWWIAGLLEKAPADTLVVLTADHGDSIVRRSDRTVFGHMYRKFRENLNRPRRANDWRRHGYHVFEELIRIPLAIAGPGVPKGKVIEDQVRQIDIGPTVLEILGLSIPPETHGRSVVPLMRGETMAEEAAYVKSGCDDFLRDWHGLRKGGWKYAEHPRSGTCLKLKEKLFDLRTDPRERRNVIRKYPKIAVEMRHQLDQLVHGESQAGQEMDDEDKAKLSSQLKAMGYI